ncbi:MAG: hypothetical protein KIT10_12220 [Flavobacteriales bacterium]|nr:hypothetical protein [Flavobacteriales bacterium]
MDWTNSSGSLHIIWTEPEVILEVTALEESGYRAMGGVPIPSASAFPTDVKLLLAAGSTGGQPQLRLTLMTREAPPMPITGLTMKGNRGVVRVDRKVRDMVLVKHDENGVAWHRREVDLEIEDGALHGLIGQLVDPMELLTGTSTNLHAGWVADAGARISQVMECAKPFFSFSKSQSEGGGAVSAPMVSESGRTAGHAADGHGSVKGSDDKAEAIVPRGLGRVNTTVVTGTPSNTPAPPIKAVPSTGDLPQRSSIPPHLVAPIEPLAPIRIGSRQAIMDAYERRVDSLVKEMLSTRQFIITSAFRDDELVEWIHRDHAVIVSMQEELRSQKSATATSSSNAREAAAQRAIIIQELPSFFGATSVYTMLRPFSDLVDLDTFRVLTFDERGGYRHVLRITTAGENRYEEEILPLSIMEGGAESRCNDLEIELLRVRMALSPGAFVRDPVNSTILERSENRDRLDLPFSIGQQDFRDLFEERPFVGCRFQSDPETWRTLVYSRRLGRIVNIEP